MKTRRALLFTITLVLALCAACGWWLHQERQQYALNQQLIDALRNGDATTALALVNEGADPNTRYKPTSVPSLPELMRQFLHRSAPPTNDSPTAFQIACGADWEDAVADTAQGHRPDSSCLVQTMLTHGAKVNEKDRNGITPLRLAVADNR